ncbi:MAG: response regulator transcription factor [Candidatus Zixiibacteriota bacterium]
MPKIKVLLLEDNRLLREGTAAMLNEQADIKVVSSPGNSGALEKARRLVPNVVLLDLGLKSYNALRVLEKIKKMLPETEVIVMDLLPAHSELVEYVKAGISGYIPKNATVDQFLHTIRSVVKGVKVLPPTIAISLFSQIVESAIQEGEVDRVLSAVKFTKREQEVIFLLAQGRSFTQISATLKVAVYTVKNHNRNILDKLALHTRLELAEADQKKPLKKTSTKRS